MIAFTPCIMCVQYRVGGGVFSTAGDIMNTVGKSWVPLGGCSVPWRYSNSKDLSPTVLNTPTVLMISAHGTKHPQRYSRYPPRTEHPQWYSWYSPPRYSRYPPMVLNTPYGTEHPFPHSTEHTLLYRVFKAISLELTIPLKEEASLLQNFLPWSFATLTLLSLNILN